MLDLVALGGSVCCPVWLVLPFACLVALKRLQLQKHYCVDIAFARWVWPRERKVDGPPSSPPPSEVHRGPRKITMKQVQVARICQKRTFWSTLKTFSTLHRDPPHLGS